MSTVMQCIFLTLMIIRLPFSLKRKTSSFDSDYHRQIFLPSNRTTQTGQDVTNTLTSDGSDEIKNLSKILESYNQNLRPNHGGPATHVQVEFKVVSFGPVMEPDQIYTLDMFFRQWWHDPSLVGVVNTTLTLAVDPSNIFWTPDTYFVNAKYPNSQDVKKHAQRLLLHPNGDIYYSSRIVLTVSCPMDFTNYPMDKQVCPLFIESYAYTQEDVFYSWHESKGQLAKTEGVEWTATEDPNFILTGVTSTQEQIRNNSKGAFSSLRVGFHLARKYGFHIWNIYIPGSLLVLMTWIGFWVPAMAYPARVTLLATSVFATIVIVPTAGSHLGPLSYAKAIDYYLLGNMTFLVMAMLEYIAILHVTANPDWFKIKATLPKLPFKGQKSENDEKVNNTIETNECENRKPSITSVKDRSRSLSGGVNSPRQSANDLRSKNSSHAYKEDTSKNNNDRIGTTGEKGTHSTSFTMLARKQSQQKAAPPVDPVNSAQILDKISRFIFPICYFSFIATHCAYLNIQYHINK